MSAKKAGGNKKTFKVKLWVYLQNQGDGSACAHFFKSEKAADK